MKKARRTIGVSAIVLPLLLGLLISLAGMISDAHSVEGFYRSHFTEREQADICAVLQLELAPGERLKTRYQPDKGNLHVNVYDIVSKESFLSRLHAKKTELWRNEHEQCNNYGLAGNMYDLFEGNAWINPVTGDIAAIRIEGFMNNPTPELIHAEQILCKNNAINFVKSLDKENSGLVFLIIFGAIALEFGFITALIAMSQGAKESHAGIARRILYVTTLALLLVMGTLTLYFLGIQADGGRLVFSPWLSARQGEALARVIGFELAPGGSIDRCWYEYYYIPDYEPVYGIFIQIDVKGITSKEDFLSRFTPEAAPEFKEFNEYYNESYYKLYGSDDCGLGIYEERGTASMGFEGLGGKPVLLAVKAFWVRNHPGIGFIIILPYIVALGWLIEIGLVITQKILRRKSKKETSHAR